MLSTTGNMLSREPPKLVNGKGQLERCMLKPASLSGVKVLAVS